MSEKDILILLLSFKGGAKNNTSSIPSLVNSLYKKYNNLYFMSIADDDELLSISGMNEKKLQVIKSIPILLQYYLKARIVLDKNNIRKYKDVVKYFKMTLRGLKFEMFSYAIFDINKNVIDIDNIFRGSISSTTIYPREIIEVALSKGSLIVPAGHFQRRFFYTLCWPLPLFSLPYKWSTEPDLSFIVSVSVNIILAPSLE